MTLQRIKLPVFVYVFVPIQQVTVEKQSMLSTNYQPKHALVGLSSSCQIHPSIICLYSKFYSLFCCIDYQNTIKHSLNTFYFYSTAEKL